MLQKFRSNQKGFTLIELMIVIAIIGILAAIAVPQFMAYRMRGYHTMAAGDCRNWVAAEAAIFEDGATYGVNTSATLAAIPSAGIAAIPLSTVITAGGTLGNMVAATVGAAGTMVNGSRTDGSGTVLDFGFPVGVGDGVELTAGVSTSGAINPIYLDSYVIVTEHNRGIRAFAADSDVSSTIFFAENETWKGSALGTMNNTYALNGGQPVVGADDLTGTAAGGSPNGAFAVLK